MVVIEADLRKKSELADQSLFASEEEKKKLLENLEQVTINNFLISITHILIFRDLHFFSKNIFSECSIDFFEIYHFLPDEFSIFLNWKCFLLFLTSYWSFETFIFSGETPKLVRSWVFTSEGGLFGTGQRIVWKSIGKDKSGQLIGCN